VVPPTLRKRKEGCSLGKEGELLYMGRTQEHIDYVFLARREMLVEHQVPDIIRITLHERRDGVSPGVISLDPSLCREFSFHLVHSESAL
jgi:hypothetical protein